MPGEPAVWLALGVRAELLGETRRAERCFEAVWGRDRREVAAAFGLARTRLAAGDRVVAAALDDVPDGTEHADIARLGAIREPAAPLPGDRGTPSADEVSAALQRLARVRPGGDLLDRLTALVLEVAILVVRDMPPFSAQLLSLPVLGDRLRRLYRDASAAPASLPMWGLLRDRLWAFGHRVRRPERRRFPAWP